MDREEALASLREALSDVDVIHTLVTHVSRDGMSRAIRPFIVADGDLRDLTYMVDRAGIGKRARMSASYDGIVVGGCGMDMAADLVYRIGRAIIAPGEPWQCRGERCSSNEHCGTPYMRPSRESWHTGDPGYRFRNRSI